MTTPAAPTPPGPRWPRLRAERTAASGDDPAEACTWLEERWSGRDFRATPGADGFSWRYATLGDARLSLHSSTFAGDLEGEVPWLQRYAVAWLREGRSTLDHGSPTTGRHESDGATPFLLPTEHPWTFRTTPHRQQQVHVDAGFLEDVAAEVHGGPSQFVAFDRAHRPTAAAVEAWRSALAASTDALTDVDGSPLRRVDAQLVVVRALLRLFAWTTRDVPRTLRAAGPCAVRAAVDHVHEHAHEALTPGDLARAAGLHVRTLQLGMNAQLGLPPMGYVRKVRLARVHEELRRAERGSVQVSDVARRWGFGNLGRFSATYVAEFGEYPRDTLRR